MPYPIRLRGLTEWAYKDSNPDSPRPKRGVFNPLDHTPAYRVSTNPLPLYGTVLMIQISRKGELPLANPCLLLGYSPYINLSVATLGTDNKHLLKLVMLVLTLVAVDVIDHR